jgi:hypothetical protein
MKRETFEQLKSCQNMNEVQGILDTLTYGGDYRFVDEKIDDGCDNGEDEYVMMRSYDFFVDGEPEEYYVKFYYGDNTLEIGNVDVL